MLNKIQYNLNCHFALKTRRCHYNYPLSFNTRAKSLPPNYPLIITNPSIIHSLIRFQHPIPLSNHNKSLFSKLNIDSHMFCLHALHSFNEKRIPLCLVAGLYSNNLLSIYYNIYRYFCFSGWIVVSFHAPSLHCCCVSYVPACICVLSNFFQLVDKSSLTKVNNNLV